MSLQNVLPEHGKVAYLFALHYFIIILNVKVCSSIDALAYTIVYESVHAIAGHGKRCQDLETY